MLENEVALVTGASRGIGRAIALELGRRGARVIGTATSEAGAASIGAAFAEAGIKGRGVVLDVASAASVEALLQGHRGKRGHAERPGQQRRRHARHPAAAHERGRLAVGDRHGPVVGLPDLQGGDARMMKARRGRIINIASVVAVMGNAGQTNYAAAKAGIIGFTKSLAREVGSRGITVNVVAPGFIETDMTDALERRDPQGADGAGAAGPPGLAGRRRPRGGVPCLPAGRLHHRRDAARQWRHVHDLKGHFGFIGPHHGP